MTDAVERMRALRWPLLVVLALLAAAMLAPGGFFVAWPTASWWVLAAALAILATAGAIIGAAIRAALAG
jgi:hypothetical protein